MIILLRCCIHTSILSSVQSSGDFTGEHHATVVFYECVKLGTSFPQTDARGKHHMISPDEIARILDVPLPGFKLGVNRPLV